MLCIHTCTYIWIYKNIYTACPTACSHMSVTDQVRGCVTVLVASSCLRPRSEGQSAELSSGSAAVQEVKLLWPRFHLRRRSYWAVSAAGPQWAPRTKRCLFCTRQRSKQTHQVSQGDISLKQEASQNVQVKRKSEKEESRISGQDKTVTTAVPGQTTDPSWPWPWPAVSNPAIEANA